MKELGNVFPAIFVPVTEEPAVPWSLISAARFVGGCRYVGTRRLDNFEVDTLCSVLDLEGDLEIKKRKKIIVSG